MDVRVCWVFGGVSIVVVAVGLLFGSVRRFIVSGYLLWVVAAIFWVVVAIL